ncbi:NPP1 family protein [Streptomyces xanthophaeus]|nr:NPP1 family protein [Streptomyces xanthophaeus]
MSGLSHVPRISWLQPFPPGGGRRPGGLIAAGLTIVLVVCGLLASPSKASAAEPDPPRALPQNATDNDAKWQPALDYDTDGCYNVPAIGPDGTIAQGLDHNGTSAPADCRDQSDLDNSNAYARQRCNSGWCVYLYDYYFEKDVATELWQDAGGHVHDWEHIAVWVQNDQAKWVSASQHGNYEIKAAGDVLWDGTHPKLVYHKDGASTHNFRFASSGDEPPENHHHRWIRSPLVSYNGFPRGLRDKLFAHDFDHATIAIKDSSYPGDLKGAMPFYVTTECKSNSQGGTTCSEIKNPMFPFDYSRDENSPGDPNPPVEPPEPPRPTDPLKVMVVGDSMTQGHEGDWTWRYRLWQWFRDQRVAVDFVGPYTGTMPPDPASAPQPPPLQGKQQPVTGPPRTSGGYAKGAEEFDSDHFAVWGRQAAQDKTLIREQVKKFKPDLLLVGLGFNDMGWFVSDANGTLASMKALVDEARAADPDLKFALANVPQRTRIGGRDDLIANTDTYNLLLSDAISQWKTDLSPVELVDWRGEYSCEPDGCPAGYDGLHPNALGEYQIARAFEKTLHDRYHLGTSVPAVPADMPARATPVPGNVVASSEDSGIKVTWDAVYGAIGYQVRHRPAGATDWSEFPVAANRFDTTWTQDGMEWEYQVRTDNGGTVKSDWSPAVRATAHPRTAPPPVGIVTTATATGVDVVWGTPTGPYTDTIDRYQVITFDKDTPGAFIDSTSVTGKSVHIDGLTPGHHYAVAVVTWNAAGGGLPGAGRAVTIGAGTPPAPGGLQVTSTDPTTVQLTWSGSPQAAGFRVWVRNINNGSQSSADEFIVDSTHRGIAYLFPGTWNYEFCVTAVNGALESAKSDCVVAPHPTG